MSEDNVVQNVSGGNRGNVGVATAALTIKKRWHSDGGNSSLKQFARKLAREGDQVAKDWLAHKKGSLNQERSEKNAVAAKAIGQASKNARRKASK